MTSLARCARSRAYSGDGGVDGQAQLPRSKRPHQVAGRVARRRLPPPVALAGVAAAAVVRSVNQEYDRDVEAAADPLGQLRTGDLPGEPDIDQRQVGTGGGGRGNGPARAGKRAADRVPQVLQSLFELRGSGLVVCNDQYLYLHGGRNLIALLFYVSEFRYDHGTVHPAKFVREVISVTGIAASDAA